MLFNRIALYDSVGSPAVGTFTYECGNEMTSM